MSNPKRLRRETPARTAPLRNFSNLYNQSDSNLGLNNPRQPSAETAPDGAGQGPVAKGAEIAYQVIEKYISEGRKTAEHFSKQPYNMRNAADSLQELLDRTLRFQSEMLPLWIDAIASLVRGVPSAAPDVRGGVGNPPADGRPLNGTTAVTLELAASRPVQVSLELRQDSENFPLVTLGLHAVDPEKPSLTDVNFVSGQKGICGKLRIIIPDGQPAGIYSGVIVNRETGEPLGTLSVSVAQ